MHGRIQRGPDGDQLLTTTEVTRQFRVNPKTVRRWALAGKITALMTPGGQRRFSANEVRALLEAAEAPEGRTENEREASPAGSPWLPSAPPPGGSTP